MSRFVYEVYNDADVLMEAKSLFLLMI